MESSPSLRLGFGTANLGAEYGLTKRADLFQGDGVQAHCFSLLQCAADSGFGYLDTAAYYGSSEQLVGQFLAQKPGAFRVVTKFLPDTFRSDTAQSLQRLGPNLWAVLWHNFDPQKHSERAPALLAELRDLLPKTKIGCSTYGAEAASWAAESGWFDLIELEYNFLNPHARRAVKGFSGDVILRSTFQKGFLTMDFLQNTTELQSVTHAGGKELTAQLHDLGLKLLQVAQRWDEPIESLALRYAARTCPQDIVLIGAQEPRQITQNKSYLSRGELEVEKVKALENLTALFPKELFDLRFWKT